MPDAMRALAGGAAEEARGKKGSWLEKKRREKRNKKRLSDLFCFEGSGGPAKMRKEVVNESISSVQYRI